MIRSKIVVVSAQKREIVQSGRSRRNSSTKIERPCEGLSCKFYGQFIVLLS